MWDLPALYWATIAGTPALADHGCDCAGSASQCISPSSPPRAGTRYWHPHPHPQRRTAFPGLPSERGFVLLTGHWRTLLHITPASKIGDIARAALVLSCFEHGYIT